MKRPSIALCVMGLFAAGASSATAQVPVYNWTGCYVGANVGGGWANKEFSDPFEVPPGLGSHDPSGIVGGGQIGCDYQVSNMFVVGVQGLFDFADLRGSHVGPDLADVFTTRSPWFATFTGRVGVLPRPDLLIYLKGGAAWIRDHHTIVDLGVLEAFTDTTRTGWTIGFGGEFMVAPGWTAFIEFNYLGFGTDRIDFTPVPPGPAFPLDIRQNVSTIMGGVNYRFGAPWR